MQKANRCIERLVAMLRLIPNILTIGRLVLSVLFLGMILYLPQTADRTRLLDAAFVIFVVAGLTDIVDGITARRLHVTTKWLRAEADAGRIPHLNADGRLLFDPECIERALLERARTEGMREGRSR